jgi:hypothetical protein
MTKLSVVLALACSVTLGCASTPAPTEKAEATSAAIRAAEEVGAPQVPHAALYLQLAVEQSEHAKELIAKGDKERAASLLMRAQADAELSLALARETQEHDRAQQAIRRVSALQQSNQ